MTSSKIEIKILRRGDEAILANVSADVFDNSIDPNLAKQFLADQHHHIIVAIDNGIVVGFVSAICYMQPDKQPELWINEVGVATTHHGQGIARLLLNKMMELGRQLNCAEAWTLTYRNNIPAMKLYASVGGKEDANDVVMFNFNLNTL
jgi:GNAT superfamily N-acetyltransferase